MVGGDNQVEREVEEMGTCLDDDEEEEEEEEIWGC